MMLAARLRPRCMASKAPSLKTSSASNSRVSAPSRARFGASRARCFNATAEAAAAHSDDGNEPAAAAGAAAESPPPAANTNAPATPTPVLEVAVGPGGLTVTARGDAAALLEAVTYLKDVASVGGAVRAGAPAAKPPDAIQLGPVWKEGESFDGVTHVIHEGMVQPLYFDQGEPFVVVAPADGGPEPRRAAVAPAALRAPPALRLPSNAKAIAALLEAGAVPGLKVARVEHDRTDYSPNREGRRFPAAFGAARKYVVARGRLRPVYAEPRASASFGPSHWLLDAVGGGGSGGGEARPIKSMLVEPGLAIYLEYEAPGGGSV